jgi:para-nitrobenzyl esterase
VKVVTLAAALSACLIAAAPALAETVERTIEGGRILGIQFGDIAVFKGVPYAAAPVGALRWRTPRPIRPWAGVLDASYFGPSCLQAPFAQDSTPVAASFSEDCLTLNLWAPRAGGPYPVMVWIHGGGFLNGGASAAAFDGAALAQQGVVVVTFNYRLGRFGFFAHPALTKENPAGPLGNYGLMDQIAVLKWVKANAATFGGDPGNVTLFGESAGGGSVAALLTSREAMGLFHKAIIESGGGRQPPPAIRGISIDAGPSMETIGKAFAVKAGVRDHDPAALRALPADKVVGHRNMINNGDRADSVNYMVDGDVVEDDPLVLIERARQARIPLIIGSNSDELGDLPGIDHIPMGMVSHFGPSPAKVSVLYAAAGKVETRRLAADLFFAEPARHMAAAAAKSGQPVFLYRFGYVAEGGRKPGTGATHASELPYVFGNPQVIPNATEADRAMARDLSAAWVRFAKTGDPSGPGAWAWPAYDDAARATLVIGVDGPTVGHDLDRDRLDYLESIYPLKTWTARAQ